MKNKFKITPDMIPKASDYIDVINTEIPDKKRLKEFKKSEKYKQYLKDYDEERKWRRMKKFFSWMDGKWLTVIWTILAFISAFPTILQFCRHAYAILMR